MNVEELIKHALQEDIGTGDATSISTIPEEKDAKAVITCKENGILCGIDLCEKIFHSYDSKIKFYSFFKDGDNVSKGDKIVEISGNARSLLTTERTVLNFLQRLSGIATVAKKYTNIVSKNNVKILDTRKTSPLLRELEKYAVKVGGGKNHRFGLFDMILIKDNHILAAGSITKAVLGAKEKYSNLKIEVETESIDMVKEALEVGVDRIMLDNMSVDTIKNAVEIIRENNKDIEIEISGGVNFENIEEYSKTGIDYISIGSALTNGSKSLDFSMNIEL